MSGVLSEGEGREDGWCWSATGPRFAGWLRKDGPKLRGVSNLPKPQWLLPVLLAIAAGLVAVYAVAVSSPTSYFDEQQYVQIAKAIAAGEGFQYEGQPTAARPPTWPLVLAPLLAAGMSLTALSAVPVIFLLVSALLAKAIATRLVDQTAGWLAAFGLLLYPLNVYTSATLYPQMLVTALVLGAFFVTLQRWSVSRAALVGFLCIAQVYAAPTMLLTAALLFCWAAWRWRSHFPRIFLIAGLAALLPLCLWTGRNLVVLDAFIPLTSTTGVNLLLGNSEKAGASSGVTADIDRYHDVVGERGLDEVEGDTYYREQALQWIRSNPGDAASLYVRKVANYFAPYNAPATAGQGGGLERLVAWLSFGVLVAAALGRFAMRHRHSVRPEEWFLWGVFLSNAPFMAIAFTRTRFRQPLDSILIIEAAVCLALLFALLRSRQPERAALSVRVT